MGPHGSEHPCDLGVEGGRDRVELASGDAVVPDELALAVSKRVLVDVALDVEPVLYASVERGHLLQEVRDRATGRRSGRNQGLAKTGLVGALAHDDILAWGWDIAVGAGGSAAHARARSARCLAERLP